ncbi:adenosine deaminase cecr1-a [Plakobranchus ocellatus]|uniref:Adenosine deaminase cecr1-a n=1 Tax=Plakobranchus ocellatus TaxID=259542 RepID=A0AAV3YXD4_9GAST|nr:adenosine deaminase cecr1-a [Plakobranchus ocellatus]
MGGGRCSRSSWLKMIILNSGEQTFVHSAYQSTSAIDLAVTSPSIAAECSWAVHSDLCGSDHFLIFVTLTSNFNANVNTPTFNFKKADWSCFGDLSSLLQSCSMRPGPPYPFIKGRNLKPECPGLPSYSPLTLQAIQSKNFKVKDIKRLYNLIRKFPPCVHISFVWIPAHVGIQGNENVDKLAQEALNKASYWGKLICWSDLKPKVNVYIHTVKQENWDAEGASKLHEVLPNLGEDLSKRGEGAGRKRETVICRLRVGHTWLTQSYFLKNEEQPFCYACDSLTLYEPPYLWGKNGHVQTIVYALMGRLNIQVPDGVRHSKIMPDGANLTFDLYEPLRPHPSGGSYCIIFCPGIGNNSESPYIQSLVHHSQQLGYIAVVLNHLGSLKKLPLTSPRLFTYGGTEELAAVRAEIERIHPGVNIILVGCSMGANIVLKYLGEDNAHQKGILAAVSVNQGYDAVKVAPMLKSWRNIGRFYLYVMTENQKEIMNAHRAQLFTPENKQKHGIDEKKVFSATSLDELDEAFTVPYFGYKSVHEYYQKMSSSNFMQNIKIPLLILNAEDDPVVPQELLEHPLKAANTQQYTIFVLTKHGGHLGFYEKGFFRPSEHTWMDRLILEYSDAVVDLHNTGKLPTPMNDVELSNSNMPNKQNGTIGSGLISHHSKKVMVTATTTANNNAKEQFEDKDEAQANRNAPSNNSGCILSDIGCNFKEENIKTNNVVQGGRDGLSGHRLVLEALRKSTNTAQL